MRAVTDAESTEVQKIEARIEALGTVVDVKVDIRSADPVAEERRSTSKALARDSWARPPGPGPSRSEKS